MNLDEIERNLKQLSRNISKDSFIYDLLMAYGKPKSAIVRLKQNGPASYNLSKSSSELIWKSNIYFKKTASSSLNKIIEDLKISPAVKKYGVKYIVVTDFKKLLAFNVLSNEFLDIKINDLYKYSSFFLELSGSKKSKFNKEMEKGADIKAAEKMAKLFDLLKENNKFESKRSAHAFNVFFSRILFCFFSEDTGIFKENQFTNGISSYTDIEGSDLGKYLDKVFNTLNTTNRSNLPEYLNNFPYVNGGLFADQNYPSPKFSKKSRQLLIECGAELNWADINPDIFGSMIQAIVLPKNRGEVGIHYTSPENILKVLSPLFLDDLREKLKQNEDNIAGLKKLHDEIKSIQIFDPACGSGNFLIVSYNELCKIEIDILKIYVKKGMCVELPIPQVHLSQFYGIEIDDLAQEVAQLSLLLAEHKMTNHYKSIFGKSNTTIPLKKGGNIIQGNATRIDWNNVCKSNGKVYIVGNPPYLGCRMQNKEQKIDIYNNFKNYSESKKVDYISCWFLKAAEYISKNNAECAFVTTNSICQGEQVSLIWPHILNLNVEINFAYTSFKWSNLATGGANVFCNIIGLAKKSNNLKKLYLSNIVKKVNNITPYITSSDNIFISRRAKPVSDLPKMLYGNMAIDDGNLIFNSVEKNEIIKKYETSRKLFRKIIGANEFLKGYERWCLWIPDNDLRLAMSIPPIKKRIDKTKLFRLSSSDKGTIDLAEKPHQFREMNSAETSSLIIPTVTSEKREYLPIGFVDKKHIIIAPNNAIYDPETYIFGILSSKMHMLWVKSVGGRLKTDIRYSSALCYNNFPLPKLNKKQKEEITLISLDILEQREKHPEKTISELYDQTKMPLELRKTHQKLDLYLESCYQSQPFKDDDERLNCLFSLYKNLTGI